MTRLSINDLLPNTDYVIRLRAVGEIGVSEWSNRYAFRTIADTVNPDVPTNHSWIVSGETFHAEWTAVTTNEQGDFIPVTRYEVELVAGGITKIDSVAPATGSTKVTYDLSLAANRALFGTARPTVAFRVRAVDNKELKGGWTSVLSATNSAPSAPTLPTAVASASAIMVGWTPPSDTDLAGFNVYVGSASNFTPSAGNRVYSGPGDKFTYNTATYSAQFFKIRAVDTFGQESADATTSGTTPNNPFIVDTVAPAVPSALAATLTNNLNGIGAQAAVTWTHTAEADLAGFSLRWKRPADSSWLQVNYPKDARSATVALNFAYSAHDFQIAAYDSSANYSAWSTVLSKAAVANTAPANVGAVTLSSSRDTIASSWVNVTNPDLAGYEVTISTSSTFASGNSVYNTVGPSYTFAGLSPSTTYYVRVRAQDNAGMYSVGYSTTASTTTLAFPATPLSDGNAPSSSPTPTVTSGIGNLFVQWGPVVNNDLVIYEIHASVTSGFTPNAGTKVGENMGTFVILETTAAGTPLAYGTTYYIKLIAKDKDGAASPGGQASGSPLKVGAGDSNLTAGDVGAPTQTELDNLEGIVDTSVKSYSTEYSVNSSESTAPVGGWSTTTPTRTPGSFIWTRTQVTYNNNTTSTTNPALLTGNTGSTGSQGIPGPNGSDGSSLYTWLKYASSATPAPADMSDSPVGKTYIGLAYNKATPSESTVYTDYTWSLVKGADGSNGANGADGNGITGTVVTYVKSTSGTVTPTTGWSTTIPATSVGEFLWTRTVTSFTTTPAVTAYSVSAHGATGNTGTPGSTGAAGRGITGTTVDYQVHTNGTTAPTGIWTPTIPVTTPGQYLWTRTNTAYSAAPLSVLSYSVAKHGDTGNAGAAGKGISGTVVTYLTGTSGTVQPTGTWSGSPTATTTGQFLWTRTVTSFTTGSPVESFSVSAHGSTGAPGSDGSDGNGITGTIVNYAVNTSGTTEPATGWGASVPATTTGQFLWTRTVTSYNTGLPTTAYSVSAHGAQGVQGNQGIQGPIGPNGLPTYTWIKYSANADGTGLVDDPTASTIYIGIAYNKLTQAESSNKGDYQWSLIQGPQGNTGAPGTNGAPGTPAAVITVTATTQVLTAPASGGATNPATAVITGSALNTTITVWEYSVNGAAYSNSVPAGVSRSGNVVTITGATMTARTIGVRMANSAGVADSITVAEIMDGAQGNTGNTGSPGAPGAAGRGITGTTVTYLTGASGTVEPTGTWQASPTATVAGQFLWTKTVTAYTSGADTTAFAVAAHGATGSTGSTGSTGTPGAPGVGISTTAVAYAKGSSGTTQPASGSFTGSIPTTVAGEFLWTRTTINYTNSTNSVAYSVSAHGATGNPGATGNTGAPGAAGLDAYTVLLTNEAMTFPGSTTAALGGSETTSAMAYKGTTQQTITVGTITGSTGISAAVTAGQGTYAPVITVTVTTALTAATGTLNVPLTVDGKSFTKVISWSVSRQGVGGSTGAPGTPGAPGGTGPQGVSVTSITPYYNQTTAAASAPAKPTTATPVVAWSTTEQAYVFNTAMWRTDKVTYSNGTFTYSDVTKSSAYEAAVTAIQNADGKSKSIFSGAPASGTTGYKAGDIWFQTSGGNIIGMWEFTTSWQSRVLKEEVIGTLSVGKLTSGSVTAAEIVLNGASGILRSSDYVPNTAGWKLSGTGLEINGGSIKIGSVPGLQSSLDAKATPADIQAAKSTNYGYRYKADITIGGDHDKYYPVLITGGDQTVKRDLLVKRSYSELHPPEWNPTQPTHGGGLTLKIKWNFGGWGGANYSWEIHELEELYNPTFGGAMVGQPSGMGGYVFLRGGGAVYHLYSDQELTPGNTFLVNDDAEQTPIVYPAVILTPITIRYKNTAYTFSTYAARNSVSTEEIRQRRFIALAQETAVKTDGWTKTGTTTIDGGKIAADSVAAAQMKAGSIIIGPQGGSATVAYATGYDPSTKETPTGAQTKANAAQTAAISAAATDATTKANNAKTAAEAAAALTAQTKADAARDAAIASASGDATDKATAAKSQAIADAALVAQTKADAARDAAITAAGTAADTKINSYNSGIVQPALNSKLSTTDPAYVAQKNAFNDWTGSNPTGTTKINGGAIETDTIDVVKLKANTTFTQNLFVGNIMTVGTASTNGIIQTYGYNPAGTAGYRLTSTELTLKSGTVFANTLSSGTGIVNNLVINEGGALRSGDYNGSGGVFDANATAGFYLGRDGLRISGAGKVAVESIQSGNIAAKTLTLTSGGNINLNGGVIQTSATANRGVEIKSTGVKAFTSAGVETFSIDSSTGNVVLTGGTLTAPFINVTAGGSVTGTGFSLSSSGLTISNAGTTSINGETIKTGSVRSSTYVTYGANPAQPVWSIGMDGTAVFSKMSILGNTVIGNGPGDVQTFLQSSNYNPGTLGWRMNASGEVEFQQVKTQSLSGDAIDVGSLNVDRLNSGLLSADVALAGSIETSLGLTTIEVNTTNASKTITTTDFDFYVDDEGVTIAGAGVPSGTIIETVVLANPADTSSKTATLSKNATLTQTGASVSISRGRRVNVSGSGVLLKNPKGEVVVGLYTDPALTNEFKGSLTATDLFVLDEFRMFGINNSLGQGSILTLNGGDYRPTSAPSVSSNWEQSAQLYNQDVILTPVESGSFYNTGLSYDYVTQRYYNIFGLWGHYMNIWGEPGAEGAKSNFGFSMSVKPGLFDVDEDWPLGGVGFDADNLYLLTRANNAQTTWKLQGFTRSVLSDGTFTQARRVVTRNWLNANDGGIQGNPVFTIHGGDTYIAKVRTDGKMVLYKYAGTNISVAPQFFTVMGGVQTGLLSTVQVGNFDLGSKHITVTVRGTTTGGRANYVYAVGASSFTGGAGLDAKNFLSPYGTVQWASAWIGTSTDDAAGYFKSIDSSGKIWNHTGLAGNSTGGAEQKLKVSMRWRNDGSGAGAAGISEEGPVSADLKFAKRSILTLSTTANIPDIGLGSPNAATFYAGVAGGTRYRYPDPAKGVKSVEITSLRSTDAAGTTASLADGIPSKMVGNNMEITGDGDAKFNSITTVNQPYGYNYRTASGTYATATYTPINGQGGQVLQGDLAYNQATGVYTVPVDGLYHVYGQALWATNSTGGRAGRITAGGYSSIVYVSPSTTPNSVVVQGVFKLTAGQTIVVEAQQSSGTSLAFNFSSITFNYTTVTKIG